MYDAGYVADDLSYMAIYENAHFICSEQRRIIDEGADLILTSIFCVLPLLQEVRLSFCGVPENDKSLSISDMTIEEECYNHHLQVVSSAVQRARSASITIHTVSLLHFELPLYHSWEEPNLGPLSESLRQLLENIKVLRLHGCSDSALELLSHCAFDLHQLDMCRVVASEKVMNDFLETSKKSIRSIGFHITPLSSSTLCRMLDVPRSTHCRVGNCDRLFWRKRSRWELERGSLYHWSYLDDTSP